MVMGGPLGPIVAMVRKRRVSRGAGESQAVFWTAPMVGSWLQLIGLKQYVDLFLENGVDGHTLLELRRDQFERCLGVTNPLHEVSLRLALLDLKTKQIDYTQWEWNVNGVVQWLALRGLDQLVGRFQAAAVNGSVLFRMSKMDFSTRLHVGELGESRLVLESLWHAVMRAKANGFYQEHGNFLDWGPVEIRDWLQGMHLLHLNDVFRDHGINGSLLPHLDLERLKNVMHLEEIQVIVVSKAIRRLTRGARRSRRRRTSTAKSLSASSIKDGPGQAAAQNQNQNQDQNHRRHESAPPMLDELDDDGPRPRHSRSSSSHQGRHKSRKSKSSSRSRSRSPDNFAIEDDDCHRARSHNTMM